MSPSPDQTVQALAVELALCEPDDGAAVTRLCLALLEALEGADLSADGTRDLAVAQRLVEGLRQGLPSQGAFERAGEIISRWASPHGGDAQARTPRQESLSASSGRDKDRFLRVDVTDREGWRDFLVEAPELRLAIEAQLLSCLRQEAFDALLVLRPLHTLKGICGMQGLPDWNSVLHACEDRLQPFRDANQIPMALAERLLAVLDLLGAQIEAIREGYEKGGFEVLSVASLEALLTEEFDPAPATQAQDMPTRDSGSVGGATDNVIRIPVSKMDSLLEAVSELAICQAQVTGGVRALGLDGSQLTTEATRLEKISRQLQQVVLGLRMVPVQPLFNRISRQAYDLSRRMGKPLRVEVSGGETEVDKGLVEELFEPLLHLVRNALDHGLETPEARRAAGKSEQCLLRLRASHQGGDFVLEMTDDGHGFDLEAIQDKAVDNGLVESDTVLTDEAVLDLIFRPGFSTAAQVTELSGRGVGLDAVKKKVQSLKGTVRAQGRLGQGATFSIRLPLTMALMEAILVRAKGERFVLPAANVIRFLAWDKEQRHQLGGGEGWYEAAGTSLPLVDLGADGQGRAVAMHVNAGGKEACLVVDEVLGKQQVVVKALGNLLKDLPGLGGGAVLADGRVGLILDIESLLRQPSLA